RADEHLGHDADWDDPGEALGVAFVLDLDVRLGKGLRASLVDPKHDGLAGLIDGHDRRPGVTEGPAAGLRGSGGEAQDEGGRGRGEQGGFERKWHGKSLPPMVALRGPACYEPLQLWIQTQDLDAPAPLGLIKAPHRADIPPKIFL